jgi:hypothetical protein
VLRLRRRPAPLLLLGARSALFWRVRRPEEEGAGAVEAPLPPGPAGLRLRVPLRPLRVAGALLALPLPLPTAPPSSPPPPPPPPPPAAATGRRDGLVLLLRQRRKAADDRGREGAAEAAIVAPGARRSSRSIVPGREVTFECFFLSSRECRT